MARSGDEIISKATLAVIKRALCELCTHKSLGNLLESYEFELTHGLSVANKLNRANSHLAFEDWSNPQVVQNLLDALAHLFGEVSSRPSFNDEDPLDSCDPAQRVISALKKRDGIPWDGKQFQYPASPALTHTCSTLTRFNLTEVNREVERICENIESDPDDTLTSAKCLVESVCRHILADFGEKPSSSTNTGRLVKATMGHLEFLPHQVSNKAKGTEAVKKLLRSVQAGIQGLVELRNLYGDPHGKGPGYKGLEPRHARLAATLAGAVATFLMETHERPKGK